MEKYKENESEYENATAFPVVTIAQQKSSRKKIYEKCDFNYVLRDFNEKKM